MISIKMQGMCEECPCADLELDSITFADGIKWFVKCTHEDACKRSRRDEPVGKEEYEQ